MKIIIDILKRVFARLKKRKWWLLGLFLMLTFGWGSGFLTGWWSVKGSLGKFPSVDSDTHLLVIAPHPDDEVLTSGGLIQEVLRVGGKVKVVFLTSGDGSRSSVIDETKKIDLSPEEFLNLGEQRMLEAKSADSILGLKEEDLIFLGFPDQGLLKLFNRYYEEKDGVFTSSSTHFDHVPYLNSYKASQSYLGINLTNDLKEIINNFAPTMVVVTHQKDHHPDHQAAFLFCEKVRSELNAGWPIYASLVHYKDYPDKGAYLFPPKKLFGNGWVSLEVPQDLKDKEMEAIKEYKSQYNMPTESGLFDRLISTNEIFEKE